ncbi:MAG: LemA family protein [Clostridia bacterium]|nr:LemA family protein [Clostridia bacterium]
MLPQLSFISVLGIFIIAFAALLFIVLPIWLISVYNAFVKLRNNVEEGFSTMDIYMKKRYDLIPNYVETVKGYAKHEKETLEKVMKARYSAMNSATTEQKLENENILQGALKSLFAVAENYPDLKANQNFIDLQKTLKELEVEIANSRKYYNGVVKIYNTKRESFPSNLIAGMFNFSKKPLFEIESAEERKNVKVDFNK